MNSLNRYNQIPNGELGIAESAHQFRCAFGVSKDLYVDIIDVLEFRVREFIPLFKLIVRRDIELDVTAETTIDPPRIYVRETVYDAACDGDVSCRHILAHELGHLLLHSQFSGSMQRDPLGYTEQFARMNLNENSEAQADVFARNFLVPPYIAFNKRADTAELARLTGTPKNIASSAATISKRPEMLKIRSFRTDVEKDPSLAMENSVLKQAGLQKEH
jgi:IrrE N-terminal-like domain